MTSIKNWRESAAFSNLISGSGLAAAGSLPAAMADEKGAASALGDMPVWDLSDLYDGPDSAALKSDLDAGAAKASKFQETYKGHILEIAEGEDGGAKLAEAVKAYEELNDLLGRIASYGQLLYSSDNQNPVHAKLHGALIFCSSGLSSTGWMMTCWSVALRRKRSITTAPGLMICGSSGPINSLTIWKNCSMISLSLGGGRGRGCLTRR